MGELDGLLVGEIAGGVLRRGTGAGRTATGLAPEPVRSMAAAAGRRDEDGVAGRDETTRTCSYWTSAVAKTNHGEAHLLDENADGIIGISTLSVIQSVGG